jgi:hypothetical protein
MDEIPTGRVPSERQRRTTSFTSWLKKRLQSDKLTPNHRAFLQRWADHPLADELWKRVQAKLALQLPQLASDDDSVLINYVRQTFTSEIIGIWDVAKSAEVLRQSAAYRTNVERAEKLADFLDRRSDFFPPLSPLALQTIEPLRRIASELGELEDYDVRGSRQNHKGSRVRGIFMQDAAQWFKHMCGQYLDDVVAMLTDIAFPNRRTTDDQVRAARRRSTGTRRRQRSR